MPSRSLLTDSLDLQMSASEKIGSVTKVEMTRLQVSMPPDHWASLVKCLEDIRENQQASKLLSSIDIAKVPKSKKTTKIRVYANVILELIQGVCTISHFCLCFVDLHFRFLNLDAKKTSPTDGRARGPPDAAPSRRAHGAPATPPHCQPLIRNSQVPHIRL